MLLGQSKPVVLDITFNKMELDPRPRLKGIVTAGFSLRGKIKRSDWGMKFGIPGVSDEITLVLEIEAQEKK